MSLTTPFVNAQSVGIGSTAFTPDASSVLEIQSTDKGMLIPRMSNAERIAIATPATGLFVYQTDGADGFYYYNGAGWVALISVNIQTELVDADADTKVEVEQTADEDKIRFTTAATERMIVD